MKYKIERETLVWKIIRNSSCQYYLVEASLPKGTRVIKVKGESKIRADKAVINHITRVKNSRPGVLCACLAGRLPNKLIILESITKDKVIHYPSSFMAKGKKTEYKAGETIKPHYFDICSRTQCAAGLHFYEAKDLPKDIVWQ